MTDFVYSVYFKMKWKEITQLLKSYGYDYSHIKLKRSFEKKGGEKNERS